VMTFVHDVRLGIEIANVWRVSSTLVFLCDICVKCRLRDFGSVTSADDTL